MNRRSLTILIASLVLATGWLYWICQRDSAIPFLPADSSAEWIVYPNPPDTTPHKAIAVEAIFRRSFTIPEASGKASLSVRAFRQALVMINGHPVSGLNLNERNWKKAQSFDVTGFLRAGENEISVTVTNLLGPPALWLLLENSGPVVKSDREWEVSLLGASWQKAALASESPPIRPGNYLFGRETMNESLRRVWPALLFILLASVVITGGIAWTLRRRKGAENRAATAIFIFIIGAWAALFYNNLPQLAALLGFDRDGHLQYIDYILQKSALPLADEGWQMYQPPLFYVLAALAVAPFGQSASTDAAVLGLRCVSAIIGIIQVALVFLGLRVLFPKQVSRQIVGLALAAFLPANLCLSHHITNETLGAVFVTAAIYFTLRILVGTRSTASHSLLEFSRDAVERVPTNRTQTRLYVGVGICLGLAMLTKFSAVLVIPFVFAALAWHRFGDWGLVSWSSTEDSTKAATKVATMDSTKEGTRLATVKFLGIAVGTLLAVCGWHYARVWVHFGKPLVGNWDPKLPLSWWQEPGYHTASWYSRFGETLVSPLFSSIAGFADGLYSSLWGDGLCSGSARTGFRPQWNYDLVNADYLLALLPAVLLVVGLIVTLVKFLRRPTPEGVLMLGIVFAFAAGILFMTLQVPSYAQVKAFYALPALLPLCVLVVVGWDFIAVRFAALRPIMWVGLAAWAITAYCSFFIRSGNPFTHTVQGVGLADEGHYAEAAESFSRALRLDTNSLAGQVGLADMLNRLSRRDEGRQAANEALRQHPKEADPHIQVSVSFGLEGRYDQAAGPMAEALALAPDHPSAYQSLAICYSRLGEYQKVIETCRQGLRVSPFDPELHHSLATACGKTGDLTNSATHLRIALALKPDWPEARAMLGLTLASLGQTQEASVEYEKALELKPGDSSLHCLFAGSMVAQGNAAAAADHYRQALALQPDLIEALNNLAWIRAANASDALRDGAEAVRLAERACELTQRRESVLLGTLAAAYAEAGRFDEAVATAEKARELALDAGQKEMAENNRGLLDLYRARKAYREEARAR